MQLPEESRPSFDERLARAGAPTLAEGVKAALFAHYQELRRWAPKLDLIGPGAIPELFERHYVESLAALPWLPDGSFRLLDVGSGAGFPGFVLAAARPDAEVWLFEARERRAAFLAAAVRKAGLGARVVAARVDASSAAALPDRINLVTLRALRLDPPLVRALAPRLAPEAAIFVWSGRERPTPPDGFATGRSLQLTGSRDRILLELRWTGAAG